MKTRAGQKIRLTSVEELLGVANEESAMDLEIAKIRPFKDHPFKVLDDEKMQDLMESIGSTVSSLLFWSGLSGMTLMKWSPGTAGCMLR